MAAHTAMTLMVVLAVLLAAHQADSAVTCGQVYSALTPCVGYIRAGGSPSSACCGGIKSLLASARTTPDRQTACGCLKTAATGFAGFNLARAAGLPGQCSVSIPYKISPSTDCSKVR